MNPIVYHVASGDAFFTGVALILLALITSHARRAWVRRLTTVLLVLGCCAVAISATPLPFWLYGLAGCATLFSLIVKRFGADRVWPSALAAAVWFLCVGWELSYRMPPTLDPVPTRQMTVIGDSVTAGVATNEKGIWPVRLAQQHQVDVQDLALAGETTASALKQLRIKTIAAPLVFVEIGGNDLLGSTDASKFRRDLDELLGQLARENRQVLLLELPLPPFCNRYGLAQRELARKHNVKLIPKRFYLEVLAIQGATLDTIHLTPTGHELFANKVWRLVAPCYSSSEAP